MLHKQTPCDITPVHAKEGTTCAPSHVVGVNPLLYILNGQKEHIRAFFVWAAHMWESIPILEHLGVMSQFPHWYIFILPPTLMWMGF